MNNPPWTRLRVPNSPDLTIRVTGLISLCLALGWFLLQNFDLFSYLPDDGAYAYVADRLNHGAVLHRDIQDVHAGYINFANAFALRLFGESMLSMRYPLLVLTLIQGCVIFWVLSRDSLLLGLLGGGAMGALTFLQFLNPTAHWYSLFLVVMLAVALLKPGRLSTRRLILIGLLVGLTAMFRQLTGAIVGCAAMLMVLARAAETQRSDQRLAVVAVLLPVTLIVAWLALRSGDLGSIVLIGVWPVAICATNLRYLQAANALVTRQLMFVVVGFALSMAPLIAYHGYHGSFADWWGDAVVSAITMSGLNFITDASFVTMVALTLEGLIDEPGFIATINAVFWMSLLLIPVWLGVHILKNLRSIHSREISPLAYFASFYCLVSLHYQIPIYLMYTAALAITALLAASIHASAPTRRTVIGVASFCIVVGSMFHAAKPLSGQFSDTLRGERSQPAVECDLPRLGLRIEADACAKYSALVQQISGLTTPQETILALPVNPELYFLSDRASALWFYNSSLGMQDSERLSAAQEKISRSPPTLVFYQQKDKYNTPRTRSLMETVQRRFEYLGSTGDFEIYRRTELPDNADD